MLCLYNKPNESYYMKRLGKITMDGKFESIALLPKYFIDRSTSMYCAVDSKILIQCDDDIYIIDINKFTFSKCSTSISIRKFTQLENSVVCFTYSKKLYYINIDNPKKHYTLNIPDIRDITRCDVIKSNTSSNYMYIRSDKYITKFDIIVNKIVSRCDTRQLHFDRYNKIIHYHSKDAIIIDGDKIYDDNTMSYIGNKKCYNGTHRSYIYTSGNYIMYDRKNVYIYDEYTMNLIKTIHAPNLRIVYSINRDNFIIDQLTTKKIEIYDTNTGRFKCEVNKGFNILRSMVAIHHTVQHPIKCCLRDDLTPPYTARINGIRTYKSLLII